MLEMLIKNEFKLYEINEAFHNRFMIERIESLFDGYTYHSLLEYKNWDWRSIPVKDPILIWTVAGRPQATLSMETLKRILINYASVADALRGDSEFQEFLANYGDYAQTRPDEQVRKNVKWQLGYDSVSIAREILEANEVIRQVKLLDSSDPEFNSKMIQMYIKLGYSEDSAVQKMYYHIRNHFRGTSPKQFCDFLKLHPEITTKKEFEVIYIREQGRLKGEIVKSDIIDIAKTYISKDDALNDERLQCFSKEEFENLLHKYGYRSWDDAKKRVKAYYLIKFLKEVDSEDPQFRDKLAKFFYSIGIRRKDGLNGIRKVLGYLTGRYLRPSDADYQSTVDPVSICKFLKVKPWVETREQFVDEYYQNYIGEI